jgi:hypothetical protein
MPKREKRLTLEENGNRVPVTSIEEYLYRDFSDQAFA